MVKPTQTDTRMLLWFVGLFGVVCLPTPDSASHRPILLQEAAISSAAGEGLAGSSHSGVRFAATLGLIPKEPAQAQRDPDSFAQGWDDVATHQKPTSSSSLVPEDPSSVSIAIYIFAPKGSPPA
jgi:hypothetical protein